MKDEITVEVIYDGPWHYGGYHGVKSVCYLRLYQPKEPSGQTTEHKPAIAIFTELDSNAGTSVTNRIEVLATMVWEFLQRPENPPSAVQHYPGRGVLNTHSGKWQFPEQFDLLEFERKPDGSFEKPRWQHVPCTTVEELIGQPLSIIGQQFPK